MLRRTLLAFTLIAVPVMAQDAEAPDLGGAAQEQPSQTERPEILVLPLAKVTEGGDQSWIGRAMHQSMMAEIARLHFVEPVAPKSNDRSASDIHDAAAALGAGRAADVEFVLFGSYHTIGDELRVTGQILDVASGDVIGGLKATGALRDLFGIEDILAAQIKRELAMRLVDAGEGLVGAPTTMPAQREVEASGPVLREPEMNGYAGSELERAVLSGTIEPTMPAAVEEDRYRYTEQPYIWTHPYTVTPYPYFPYRNYYRRDRDGRRTIVSGTIITPENNNFIQGTSHTMSGGTSHTMSGGTSHTMTGGTSHTMSGGASHTMTGGPGHTMTWGPGNTMQNGPDRRPQRVPGLLPQMKDDPNSPTRMGNILRRGPDGRITGTPSGARNDDR